MKLKILLKCLLVEVRRKCRRRGQYYKTATIVDKVRSAHVRSLAPPIIIAMFNVQARTRSSVGGVPTRTRRVQVHTTATALYARAIALVAVNRDFPKPQMFI